MNKKLSLTEGRTGSVLILFSIPFLLSSFLQVLYGAVDVFLMDYFASSASISGVASSTSIMGVLTAFFMGLTNGGTVLLGQYVGAKQNREAASTTGNIIIVFAGICAVSTLILLFFGNTFISLMNVPREAVSEARIYLFICSIGATFIMGYNVVSSILRGLGNSKAPLFFVAISSIIHIILGCLFVGFFKMGAAGAGLATVISQAISFIIALLYIRRVKLPYSFKRSDINPDPSIIKRIFKIGVPMSLQNTLVNFSFVIIGRIINNMGVHASAAAGVVSRIIEFSMTIPFSLGSAISAITAQNIGAAKPERARKSALYGALISLIIAVPFCLISQFRPELVVSILSRDPDVIAAGALYLIPYSWDCVLVTLLFCLNGLYNGCGRTLFVMINNLATTFLVRIPIAYFMSLQPGASLFHVGLGTPIATLVSLIPCIIYLRLHFSSNRLANLSVVR